jgi:phosphoglycerate dehydrogenase-like enzyme
MADKVVVPQNPGRQEDTVKALEAAGFEVVRVPNPLPGDTSGFTPDLIQEYFSDAVGFMGVFPGRRITREVLAAAPRLRVGVSPIIGTDTFDVDAATELGIVIGYGAAPENLLGVAEAVVMQTANLVKHLPQKW